MKTRSFFLFLLLMMSSALFAQVGINTDNSAPDSSAMLDVKSTDKGFLPPRMTTGDMNSIITPAQGLMVYNITVNSLYWFNGSAWTRINEPYSETDPVFTAHPAYGITAGSIGNWNTAYTNRIESAAGASPLALSLSGNQLNGSMSTANSTANGYLTSTDWNTFKNKQSPRTFGNLTSGDITVAGGTGAVIGSGAILTINKGNLTSPDMTIVGGSNAVLVSSAVLTINKGNLTESGSTVLTITGGGNAVLGTGTSIQVKQANASQPGYLGSADWNTFNNKVSSQWTSNGLKLYYNSGNAGIGASNPQNTMDIAGNAVIGATYSGSGAAPANGLLVEGKVGIGTSAPASSASLDVTSTNTGVLFPRMTTTQRNLIASPAAGLIIYNTENNTLDVFDGTIWKSMTPVQSFTCGVTIGINHLVSGGVAPVNKTVEYGTVTGIPGEPAKCWITCNLGADHQANAVSDATEASAGWYWQFNRKQGYKHDGTTRTPNTTWITYISEESGWLPANDPCSIELGSSWRIPTETELMNIWNFGGWSSWTGPWNSGLKLHAAGYIGDVGTLTWRGTTGFSWSSVQSDPTRGVVFYFSSAGCGVSPWYNKQRGISVRCIREN